MLEIKNLTFGYSQFAPIFTDLQLRLNEGGIYGLLGPNGAGKSTLLHLMSGLLTPLEGSVEMDSINVRLRMPSVLADTFIVPEEFDLPKITMDEYCRINAPFYPRFSEEDLRSNLATFNLSATDNLGLLSMGQKKKAFMCFALACNTRLLLMDEPTNGLDLTSKGEFRRFIASHMDPERIIIISTHQVHDVALLLDHVILLGRDNNIIHASMEEISARLCFYTGMEPDAERPAIFTAPTLGGNSYITVRQAGDQETEVNLESLFEFAVNNPASLSSIINSFPASMPVPPLPTDNI